MRYTKIIITKPDAEKLDEPEYWTEEEEGVMNELAAFAVPISKASLTA